MKKTSNPTALPFATLTALILAAALCCSGGHFAVEGGFADLYYRMNDSAEVLTEDSEDNELEASLEAERPPKL